jgi:galactose mutarotase-like enzyme
MSEPTPTSSLRSRSPTSSASKLRSTRERSPWRRPSPRTATAVSRSRSVTTPTSGCPACREWQLPSGATRAEGVEDDAIGARVFDDLYELGDDRELSLAGGGRRLVVDMGDGYRYAQVFAPPGVDFVCLEPMTAPTNALVDGSCRLVEPGTTFTARFSIRVESDR